MLLPQWGGQQNAYYPLALRIAGPSSSLAESAPKDSESGQSISASALPSSIVPPKEVDQIGAAEKEKEPTKEVTPVPTKFPPAPKDFSKEKGASQSQELVLVTLPFRVKEDPKGKGVAQSAVPEVPAKAAAKTNPPPSKTK